MISEFDKSSEIRAAEIDWPNCGLESWILLSNGLWDPLIASNEQAIDASAANERVSMLSTVHVKYAHI